MAADSDLAELLYRTGTAYRQARALLSAIELDLFSVLASEPLSVDMLAVRIGIDRRGARDFFDALVALGLLIRTPDGPYQNTKATDLYLDKAKPSYLGGSFDQYSRREYDMWGSLTDALRTGRPRTVVNGSNHFDSIYNDPVRFQSFVNAMTAGSLLSARRIAEQFPWQRYATLCDVGTAQGCLPVQIALKHSNIEAIGFDLPELRPAFLRHVHDHALVDRVTFKAGSFFNEPLPEADVIIFGRVLHNWDLATKKMLLAKAYAALPKDGAVIVYDMLIDDERSSDARGLLSSLNMLLWTSAGFGYTAADCISWMHEAGFHGIYVEPLAGGNSMVVGTK